MKPKKSANSIKKNKESIVSIPTSVPTTSTKPNIWTMLSSLPMKKTSPIKISQVKCHAPKIDSCIDDSKEWHVPSDNESDK